MDRRHMSFSRAVSVAVPGKQGLACVGRVQPRGRSTFLGDSLPAASIPHKRRQRMSKHAMLALAVLALGLAPVPAPAQGREVTGRVTRVLGEVPVGLATVTEVGGQGVAQSGADGTFRITVAAGDVRLVVRAIGYQKKEVTVNAGESNVVVTLAEDPFKLEAVVVTGQATTVERRNATTATAQVTN